VTEPGSSSSCGSGADEPVLIYWKPARGKPYLWAVVPNEVVSITVGTGKHVIRAPVHENAFYFQLDGEVRLQSLGLTVAYEDGSVRRLG